MENILHYHIPSKIAGKISETRFTSKKSIWALRKCTKFYFKRKEKHLLVLNVDQFWPAAKLITNKKNNIRI